MLSTVAKSETSACFIGDYYLSMSNRLVPLALGEYYHIYSRGVDKRKIFLDNEDEKRFVKLLFICNGSKPLVYRDIKRLPLVLVDRGECQTAIGAYCIMPNHFHLLVKETKEKGITNFMRKFLTSYSKYFNTKYKRTGALFGSEFKSEHLDRDEYLKYIFSYIHLNPLKLIDPDWKKGVDEQKATNFLSTYTGSSYLDYKGLDREESVILNKLAFPDYFPYTENFDTEIRSWFVMPK